MGGSVEGECGGGGMCEREDGHQNMLGRGVRGCVVYTNISMLFYKGEIQPRKRGEKRAEDEGYVSVGFEVQSSY